MIWVRSEDIPKPEDPKKLLGFVGKIPEEELTLGHNVRCCGELTRCQWVGNLDWILGRPETECTVFVCAECRCVWQRTLRGS